MTIARAHLVDPAVTRWYHCVRAACDGLSCSGKGCTTARAGSSIGSRNLRKSSRWPSRGFAILDNHLHLLVRLDLARGWSDEDVVRRWGCLLPPRDKCDR